MVRTAFTELTAVEQSRREHWSAEEWAQVNGEKLAALGSKTEPVRWSPPSASTLRNYEDLPVVLIVTTRAHEGLHQAVFQAVEILQESTYAFRTIVLTEASMASSVRDFDFRVDTFFDEWEWAVLSERPWLDMVAERLKSAAGFFAAHDVVAATDRNSLLKYVQHIVVKYRASSQSSAAALRAVEGELAEIDSTAAGSLRGVKFGEDLLSDGRLRVELGRHGALIIASSRPQGSWILLDVRSDPTHFVGRQLAENSISIHKAMSDSTPPYQARRLLQAAVRSLTSHIEQAGLTPITLTDVDEFESYIDITKLTLSFPAEDNFIMEVGAKRRLVGSIASLPEVLERVSGI